MIVVDVETSGLDPLKNSILSIGAVDFGHPGNSFYMECRIDPDARVDARALEVNGFTHEQINDPVKPTLPQILKDWLGWAMQVEDRTLAGHNTFFDYGMLSAACHKYDLGWPFGMRVLDTHSLCYGHMRGRGKDVPLYGGSSGITNDIIFEYVGLTPEPKPHNGLTGAKMEAEAFSRLMLGRGLFDEYGEQPLPDYLLR